MTRKLKVLGLALTAVLAMSAVTAGAALAESKEFTAAKYPTTLTASQTSNGVFEIGSLKVTCSVVKGSGLLSAASETLTLAPTYEECEALGLKADVKANGCTHRYRAPLVGSEEGSVDILCPEGGKMEINAATCTIGIAAQAGVTHVKYLNTASDIDVHATLTSVHATVVKDTILCPLESSTIATAKYTGDFTLQGSSAMHVG